MIQKLKMTVLVDNVASEPLLSEWGLSILIAADGRQILLDTGASGIFAQNAERLGVDLAAVETGVLSHAHYDHADGLDTFFKKNQGAPFLVREGACENCYGVKDGVMRYNGIRNGILEEFEERIQYVRGTAKIADGIWLVPHRDVDYAPIALRNELFTMDGGELCPDSFSHEQSLIIETARGLVVFNSCSHTGLANILDDVRDALGRDDVFAYVGGLHLYKMKDNELAYLCREIGRTGIERIYTGHCTGEHAFQLLKTELGDRIEQFSSGFSCCF